MPRTAFDQNVIAWSSDKPSILTWSDLDAVTALLEEIAPCWSAELNQSGPGDSTITVTPEGANDLIGPAFVLHRTGGRVHLDQFRWDEYRKLGGFVSLDAALAAMSARLVALASNHARTAFRET